MSDASLAIEEDVIGFLKFNGPSVDGGQMRVDAAGRSLTALGKIFENYLKMERGKDINKSIELRVFQINKSSTEFGMCVQEIAPILKPLAATGSALIAAQALGITELTKSFFGTVGEQLALKLFSQGKNLLEVKKTVGEENKIMSVVTNLEGAKKIVAQSDLEQYKLNEINLKELVQLEKGKAEELQIGYVYKSKRNTVAKVKYSDKPLFDFVNEQVPARERFDEEFDESKTTPAKIVGQFMDYYGFAQKYHFSFQARKKQEEIGRQFILCIVPQNKISEIIDLLKPDNKKNVCIYGKAQKNAEGKYDKIKIEYISEDEEFNPSQVNLFDY